MFNNKRLEIAAKVCDLPAMIRFHIKLPLAIVLAIVGAALLASIGTAGAAGEDALPDAAKYRQCVDLSARTPRAAQDVAMEWLDAGGGIPAQHCAALSLAGLGRYGEAARALEAAAEGLRVAKRNNAYTGFFRSGEGLVGELLGQAGNAWLLAGDAVQAYTAFSNGLTEVAPGSDLALKLTIDRARASGVAADYVAAMEDLNKAAQETPDRVEIFVLRANVHRKLDQLDAAAADLERVFEMAPNNREALLERGNMRLMTNDLAGAEADWLQIIALYPESPAAAYAHVNLWNLRNDGSDEIEELEEAN